MIFEKKKESNFRTLSTSITTDNFGKSSPPLINTYESMETRLKSMTISANHQENIPPLLPHPRSLTMSTERKMISNTFRSLFCFLSL